MIELVNSILLLVLGAGLLFNVLTTRRLIKAVDSCTKLTVMAILYQRPRLW